MGQIIERRGDHLQPRGSDGRFDGKDVVGIERRGGEGVIERTVNTDVDAPKQVLSQHDPQPGQIDPTLHALPVNASDSAEPKVISQ